MIEPDSQNTSILKELSDIKASLAVNTSETQNIKGSMAEIKVDIREIKTNFVTQNQYETLANTIADHELRVRDNEKNIIRILTWGSAALLLLGILEFIINKYL